MKRLLKGLLILVLVLAVLFVVALQIVIHTDLPRQLAVDLIEEETGLRVEIDALQTSWSGKSELRGVRLWLPGADEPWVSFDAMVAQHTDLPWVVLLQDFTLESLEADGVKVSLEQDPLGRWNLQSALSLMATGAPPEPEAAAAPVMTIPYLDLRDVTLSVQHLGHEPQRLVLSQLKAVPIGPAASRLELVTATDARVEGRVVTRGDWSHHLTLDREPARAIAELLPPTLLPEELTFEDASLIWEGMVVDGVLQGRLNVRWLAIGDYRASGVTYLRVAGEELIIEPRELRLDDMANDERIFLRNGTIRLAGSKLSWQRVDAYWQSMTTRSSGEVDLAAPSGEVRITWNGVEPDMDLTYEGSATLSLARPLANRWEVSMQAATSGRRDAMSWDSRIEAEAGGPSWQQLDWRLAAPVATVTLEEAVTHAQPVDAEVVLEPRQVRLGGLQMNGQIRWPRILVDELRHQGGGTLTGHGSFNADTQAWHAELTGESLDLVAWLAAPLDVRIDMTSDGDAVALDIAHVQTPQVRMAAEGSYDLSPDAVAPLTLRYVGGWARGYDLPPLPIAEDEIGPPSVNRNGDSIIDPDAPLADDLTTNEKWAARALFEGDVTADVVAQSFHALATVRADGIRMDGRRVEPVAATVSADGQQGSVSIRAEPFDAFGGTVELTAQYRPATRRLRAEAEVNNTSLATLMKVFDPAVTVEGTASGVVKASMALNDPERTIVDGEWEVRQFRYNDMAFDRMTGRLISRRPRVLRLDPITVIEREGDDAGRANGRVVIDLRGDAVARASMQCTNWPVAAPALDSTFLLNGLVGLRIDLRAGDVVSEFDTKALWEAGGETIGNLAVTGRSNGQRLEIIIADSPLLDGHVSGEATIELDKWWTSRGSLSLAAVSPSKAARWAPGLEMLEGPLTGRVEVAPATDPRAPEPLRVKATFQEKSPITYAGIAWQPVEVLAYGGPKRDEKDASKYQPGTMRRWLIERAVLDVGDGRLELWASLNKHNDQWFDHVRLDAKDVRLERFAHLLGENEDVLTGRVSGQITLHGRMGEWATHTGSGRIELAQSNLQRTDLIGQVMTVLGGKPPARRGAGLLDVRLENDRLTVEQLIYRQRPKEILLRGYVENISKGKESRISGIALASVQPLRTFGIVQLEDVNRLLRAVQANLTTVRIGGTLDDPNVAIESLEEVERDLKKLLNE